ncbi:MAG: InlB B-repeat-containing protein [Paludibacteraceae bacterium]|nr:InlB B-repeat-containing protein [Paludibacteraceae bacterium]
MRKVYLMMAAMLMTLSMSANPTEEQVADYYLSHPYLFSHTALTATGNADYPYKNAEGENIKMTDDGWSDFHWDGPSSCIFDNINMSTAGKYYVKLNYRGTTSDGSLVVNGDTTALILDGSEYVKLINLNAGMNTIKVCKGTWIGVYSIELSTFCPSAEVAQAADYYLSNPYYFECTTLTPKTDEENVYYNAANEKIKLYADGWSDFHWDGPSNCIFDNINMSKAGKYTLIVNYRGTTSNGTLVVNDESSALTLDGQSPYKKIIDLKAGMNTIKLGKGEWFGVKSIELAGLCQDDATTQAADYYLNNTYYFQCTALRDTVAHDENVKYNADGLIKLTGDGWSDFHWDGPSRAIFDNINMSEAGDYTMTVVYRNTGNKVDVIVNDETQTVAFAGSPYEATVALKAGMNTIKIGKNDGWIGVFSLDLKKVEKIFNTTITLDQNGGTGGETSVVAQKGKAMPDLASLPTRENFFFNGYATEKDGGDLYYDENGKSAKNWDKEDETFTLYAQWYNGAPEVAVNVECPDKEAAKAPDYYLNNMYYALCTPWVPRTVTDSATGRSDLVYDGGAEVLIMAEGEWVKLCGDRQYVDFHWDDFPGKSAITFTDIYVSEDGDYDMHWYQRNGGKVDIILNGDTFKTVTAAAKDTLTVFRMPLKQGTANKVKIVKNSSWPQTLGVMFSKSEVIQDTTLITFDMQGGTGGTETVEAIKGYDMPTVTIPVKGTDYFEGYFTEIEGGDQYYNPDGTSMKAWDKSDKTFTLYAHWNDGGTEGECYSTEDAIKEDFWFSHMYDARCTELTNTWEKDNNEYIYLNAEGERIKITANGEWIDYYWADPSSIVFDSIYVSRDMICNFKWFFRCDNIDGEPTAGSRSQVWVNDELFGEVTVWISDPVDEVPVDETVVEGIELYADWPNKIKIQKINGWPLTRGIQLVGEGLAVENTKQNSFFIQPTENGLQLNRLEGKSDINIYSATGALVVKAQTTEKSYNVNLVPGSYIVNVNGEYEKAIVR